MKRLALTFALVLPVGLLAACNSCPFGYEGDDTAEMVLCDGCGVEKGTEGCCDPDAAKCSSCDKIKGSPGCCK